MTRFGFAILLVLSAQVFANEMPISMPDSTQTGFTTADEAVTQAYVTARTLSRSDESGGAIYQTGDKFFYTLPVTTHEGAAIDYRVGKPKGSTLIALYHTHPGKSVGIHGFSLSDCRLARDMNLIMYVNVIEDHTILVFDPKYDTGRRIGREASDVIRGGRQFPDIQEVVIS